MNYHILQRGLILPQCSNVIIHSLTPLGSAAATPPGEPGDGGDDDV